MAYKNTALHYACSNGHVEAVQLLLEKKADVSLTNTYNNSALDLAIDNLHQDVVMIFDYQYIDPGPDDASSQRNRYLALNTMVHHGRDVLLSHPLCQNLLFQKWVRFGRSMFIINLLTYIGYLTCLTALVVIKYQDCPPSHTNISTTNCKLEETEMGESLPVYRSGSDDNSSKCLQSPLTCLSRPHPQYATQRILTVFLYVFVAVFFVRDFIKILSQRWRYILNIYNTIVWLLMLATVSFLFDSQFFDRWRAAWVAMFLAWINFIMYLRRIDFLGIYVIMFVSVLTSLVKGSFEDIFTSIISVLIMTLGEVNYLELKQALTIFRVDGDVLIIIFVFLMPIALMNLMIGVAVGDIEKIQRNAYLKRIGLQVDLMYNIENNMPRLLQKKFHIRRTAIKPNEEPEHTNLTCFGQRRKVQFIEAEKKDKTTSRLESLIEKTQAQQQSIKVLTMTLQQQNILLHEIARKFEVSYPHTGITSHLGFGGGGGPHGGAGGFVYNRPTSYLWDSQSLYPSYKLGNNASNPVTPEPSVAGQPSFATTIQPPHQPKMLIPESVSVYQNVNLDGVDRWRKRSIRPTKNVVIVGDFVCPTFDDDKPKTYI
ncbi:hypothetical protein HELRODRAFT_159882 [Helobdella robusta]|uniref:Uncharacterized protein n=1 Tax=Helobdella robusta TaxID=6412 RepID=T1EPH7_HELRO|nr:hypothetical protein HELRODRAFT_159882 [Helobdella robusta]ESO13244.1 hypothetical protein HELRODRAFT_159882 [Helobdella robusta]